MRHIDVFKCIQCNEVKSGLELGQTIEFPYASPPRLECTCRDCLKLDACELVELSDDQTREVQDKFKSIKGKGE